MTLSEFFEENPETAVALSGGVDSAYLLFQAAKCAKKVRAYFVRSQFQPEFELEDARKIAETAGAELEILTLDVLKISEIAANGAERCYFCKKAMFSLIAAAAEKDGFSLLLDGTNASDDESDRPGTRAKNELRVRSPLRECGLEKSEIRRLAREAGLHVWDKPAYACLATRIRTGERIDENKLKMTEQAENFLASLGFSDFRVRLRGGAAVLQIKAEQFALAAENREKIVSELKKSYGAVMLDMEARE